jgi:putative transposase
VIEILKEEKTLTQLSSGYGVSTKQLTRWRNHALAEMPRLFENNSDKKQEQQAEKINELYAEIGRLATQVNRLKKNLGLTLSGTERLSLVERGPSELTLQQQAELLSVSRSSLYYQPVPPSAEEIAIKHRLDELYTDIPSYGSRKLAVLLRPTRSISRKRVQRYMRQMGLVAIYPGPKTSQPAPYPYLLRRITASYPNHVWGTDITYIKLKHGWMYLVAIPDWYSRFVVSWALDQTLEMPFVLTAVDQALAQAQPLIINSDQGRHFTSPHYLDRFLTRGVQISMDGRGRAMDNIFTERLWRSVKYEEVYLNEYDTPRQAREGLTRYFQGYNYQRPHQSLGYLTPAAVYLANANEKTNERNEQTTTNNS